MATAYESELELEEEVAGLGEFEQHEGEQHEWEQHELAQELEQHELAGELEGDQFFGRAFRGIRRFAQRAAPLLGQIARVAAPVVGTAIGGPFGAVLGRVASQALGEEELAQEWEQHELENPELAHELGQHELAQEWEQHEFEHELESPELAHEFGQHELAHEFEQHESAQEAAFEIAHHEVSQHEAIAEIMAEAASHEQNEAQAEAMMGAAVVTVLSPRDRRALRRLLPHLVRGASVLTRILRRRRATRPAVRAVPTIMRRTVVHLKRQAAAGQPVTRRAAGRAAATEVRRVLSSPSACAAAIQQNVRAVRRSRANGKRLN